jgi:hypothetical protein
MNSVMPCSCKHPAQDGFYGAGNRLFIYGEKSEQFGCSVCGAKKTNGEAKKKGKGGK